MTAEEFEKWVFENTNLSVYDVADINQNNLKLVIDVESIKSIAEAYHKAKVESITDEDFTKHFFDETKVNPSLVDGAIRGYKWLKSQLQK